MAEYLDGTSEIQNVVVARSLLGGALDWWLWVAHWTDRLAIVSGGGHGL